MSVFEAFEGASKGLCRGAAFWEDPIDPMKYSDRPRLVALCNTPCPVRKACENHGLMNEKYGVWGGKDQPWFRRERLRLGLPEPMNTITWSPSEATKVKIKQRAEARRDAHLAKLAAKGA